MSKVKRLKKVKKGEKHDVQTHIYLYVTPRCHEMGGQDGPMSARMLQAAQKHNVMDCSLHFVMSNEPALFINRTHCTKRIAATRATETWSANGPVLMYAPNDSGARASDVNTVRRRHLNGSFRLGSSARSACTVKQPGRGRRCATGGGWRRLSLRQRDKAARSLRRVRLHLTIATRMAHL